MFTPGEGGRVSNTLLVTGRGIDTSYDMIHLVDAFGFAESDSVDPGTSPVTFELSNTVIGPRHLLRRALPRAVHGQRSGRRPGQLGKEPELAVIDIDPTVVADVRTEPPVLANARSL